MESHSLGDQELDVLRYVADHAPITARDVAEGYGQEHSLAKTTVLTVMERLRKKKYLTRRRKAGLFYYSPCVPKNELLQQLVKEFVQKTLAGSVSPFVAYLSKEARLNAEERDKLKQIIREMEEQEERDNA